MTVLADFKNLTKAEGELVKWLQAGNRKTCVISEGVPDGPSDDVTLRATFIRYLALGGCDTCRLPETGLRVAGAYILGDEENSESTNGLDLEGATLPYDLALVACHIPDLIILRSAKVKNLIFDRSNLKNGLFGEGLIAQGGLLIRHTKIEAGCPLGSCLYAIRLGNAKLGSDLSLVWTKVFEKAKDQGLQLVPLHCDGIRIQGSLFLSHAVLFGTVRLLDAEIGGSFFGKSVQITFVPVRKDTSDTNGIAFGGDRLQVQGTFDMRDAKVNGVVRLHYASVQDYVDFSGCELNSTERVIDCNGATIGGSLLLRGGLSAKGIIDLTAATIGAINDDPGSWPPELLLERCRYGAFLGRSPTDAETRKTWLALQKPRDYGQDFWPDSYEHCAKVLREMGHGAEATKILIEKEKLQREARRAQLRRAGQAPLANLRWLSDWILGITTRYGRQPLWAFVWLLGFWAFGALMFDQAAQRGEIKPNLPQIQRAAEWVDCADGAALRLPEHAHQLACFHAQPEGQSHPRFNAIFYSADTLFPVVALEMQSYWIPDDTKPFGKYARWYLWAHIIAGWALTLLAVAGFSGLIKTDNTT